MAETPPGLRSIPRGVVALGLVSLLMDTSSEMIHGLLPVFLTTALGATALEVGWIEGVAEAIASITKIFSGTLSDHLGRRKALALAGYGLAALSKPLFPLAPSVGWVAGARFLDRIGKGIRGAPRDAMVGELTPAAVRGASYGLRQSLDTVGAFLGPSVAIALMAATRDDFRTVFWIATVPAFLAVAVLQLGVSEPRRAEVPEASEPAADGGLAGLRRLPRATWVVVIAAGAATLGRFGEAFLILRAESVGVPLTLVPLVLVGMNVAYAASAYPVGRLSDRVDRRLLLGVGFAVLAVGQGVLAVARGPLALAAGIGLWGLHLGMTQGLFSALVGDVTPARLLGSAFGVFHLLTGLAVLAASVVAGWLYGAYGAAAPFAVSGVFLALAIPSLLIAGRSWGPGEP
jgi:MFS family permease